MTKRGNLAVGKWHKILKETRQEAEESLDIRVVGHTAAVAALLGLLGPGARAVFKPKAGEQAQALADLLIMVVSGNEPIEKEWPEAAKSAGARGTEVIALIDDSGLADAAREAKKVEAEMAFNLSPGRIAYFSQGMDAARRRALLRMVDDRIGSKDLALAAKVPSFRPLVVGRIIQEVSAQNAVIGAAGFIPASDMPALTANQIRMVLKIAAAYGATISLKRAKELLVVVGGGFTFRAVARQLVGLVPVAGWAVKGAVAFTGTRALGELAAKYFAGLDETD